MRPIARPPPRRPPSETGSTPLTLSRLLKNLEICTFSVFFASGLTTKPQRFATAVTARGRLRGVFFAARDHGPWRPSPNDD